MRRTVFSLTLTLLAVASLALVGCEGPAGPEGPAGTDGMQGPEGPQGPQGPAGPGPSVVKFSFDDGELEGRDGRGAREAFVQQISDIDSAVVDSGTVEAYLERYPNGNISQSSVQMNNQNSENGESVTVQNVYVPEDGYIAIHDSTLQDGEVLGSVIGVSQYLERGTYEQITVDLYQGVPGQSFSQSSLDGDQTLIAMPHRENSGNENYNFVSSGGSNDGPYTSAGDIVLDPAFVTVGTDSEVIMNDQESGGETITVRSVYVPRDGYVAVHDTSLQSGAVQGSVIGVSQYLNAGFYNNLDITLFDVNGKSFPADTTLPGDQALIAMPHEETSSPTLTDEPEYDFITSDGSEDGPFFVEENSNNGPVTDSGVITVTGSTTNLGPRTNVNGDPNTTWAQLPLTFMVDDPADNDSQVDFEVNVSQEYDYSEVAIVFSSLEARALTRLDGEFNVKVVIIPPEASGSSSTSGTNNYNFSTYQEAADHFGLTEEDVRTIQ